MYVPQLLSVPREFRDSAAAEKSAEFSKPRRIWKTPRNPAERGENRPFQILVSMYARRTPGSERVAFQSFDSLKVFLLLSLRVFLAVSITTCRQ